MSAPNIDRNSFITNGSKNYPTPSLFAFNIPSTIPNITSIVYSDGFDSNKLAKSAKTPEVLRRAFLQSSHYPDVMIDDNCLRATFYISWSLSLK